MWCISASAEPGPRKQSLAVSAFQHLKHLSSASQASSALVLLWSACASPTVPCAAQVLRINARCLSLLCRHSSSLARQPQDPRGKAALQPSETAQDRRLDAGQLNASAAHHRWYHQTTLKTERLPPTEPALAASIHHNTLTLSQSRHRP